MLEKKVAVIAVQETHTASAERLRRRGNLTGFTLVDAVYSSVHGIATYIRSDCERMSDSTIQWRSGRIK
jgi:hypothetical protein